MANDFRGAARGFSDIASDRSESVDSLFEALKEAKKDQDDLLKKQLEIQQKDTDRKNKAILEGAPGFFSSVTGKFEEFTGEELSAAVDIQKGKMDRALARIQSEALMKAAVEDATEGRTQNLQVIEESGIEGLKKSLLGPEDVTITPEEAVAKGTSIKQPVAPNVVRAKETPPTETKKTKADFNVPEVDRFGNLTAKGIQQEAENKAKADAIALDAKNKAEVKAKRGTASVNALRSAELVSSAMGRFASKWTDAFREGGVGSGARALFSHGALNVVGSDLGDKFENTSALVGLKTEIIAKMMPLMTQQGDKEGSVRLVKSIFERLEQTIPDNVKGPKAARNQIGTTVENMYGFARAFQVSGVNLETLESMSDEQVDSFVIELELSRDRILRSEQERKIIDGIVNKVVSPINKLIEERAGKKKKKKPTAKDLGLPTNFKVIGEVDGEV